MFPNLTKLKNLQKLIFVFSIITIFSIISRAAPGALDTTFGTGGKTITAVGTGNDYGNKVVLQPDGKIIVGGYSVSAGSFYPNFSLARYNPDGILDTTFGSGGKVITELDFSQEGYAIAVQSDGKIILAGNGLGGASFSTVEIHRYNEDGSLDLSFGGDGIVTNAIGDSSQISDLAIQPDGKIVAVGYASFAGSVFLAVRYNSDGTLDTSFNDDGIYTSPNGGLISYRAYAVAIQPDGKIIIGGEGDFSAGGVWIRFNSDGTPIGSGSLGSAGVLIRDVALQTDGKIVFAGTDSGSGSPTNNIGVERYNSNGTYDNTFGMSFGTNFVNFGADSFGTSIVIQNDGRILVGGYTSSSAKDFALARFNTNGFLDVGFGNDGKVITSIGNGDDQINGLALQTDGKILAAGTTFNGTDNDFAIARFLGGTSATLANNTPYDFDGDGRADTAVFRNGNWYILQSLDNSYKSIAFGQTGDKIVPADFDGDGRTDTAVFRPSNSTWYYLRSSDDAFVAQQFGTSDSLPRPGDYDCDGRADIAVFYPPSGQWYIQQSQNSEVRVVKFGMSGDVPVIANFDGDNKDDITVHRPSSGTWYWLNSANTSFNAAQFGASGDLPTIADYDGDGKSDISVFRPSNGTWYQLRSTSGFSAVQFGIGSDRPAAADYDGDGKTDTAVFRDGNWYELQSSNNGFVAVSWGQSGDISIPSAYIP